MRANLHSNENEGIVLGVLYKMRMDDKEATVKELSKETHFSPKETEIILQPMYDLGLVDKEWITVNDKGKRYGYTTWKLPNEVLSIACAMAKKYGIIAEKTWICNVCGAERNPGEVLEHLTEVHGKELINQMGTWKDENGNN
jgi:hypothetical protein